MKEAGAGGRKKEKKRETEEVRDKNEKTRRTRRKEETRAASEESVNFYIINGLNTAELINCRRIASH